MQLPTDRYVDVDGLRLRYWVEGQAGPNLVFVHGIGGAVDVWRKQFERLPQSHRTLALDLPGCGRSAIPPVYPRDTLRLLAASVRSVMLHVGMEHAIIIGSSLGGAVATEFAMRWPEMVEGLVLVGPAGMTTDVTWALRILTVRGVGELLSLPDRARTGQALRQCVAEPQTVDVDDIDRAFAMASLPGAQDAFLRLLRVYAGVRGLNSAEVRRLQAAMRTIHAPVLVLWGAQDAILSVNAAATALDNFPNAALLIRPASGHLVFVDEPAWFDALVTDFATAPARVLAQVRTQAPVAAAHAGDGARTWRVNSRQVVVASAALALFFVVQFVRQRGGPGIA